MVQQSNLDASMMLSLTGVMVPVAFTWFQQKKVPKASTWSISVAAWSLLLL